MKVALFPLSAHILPRGRMALRIFEPRYLRMVKEALANNQPFAICMLDSQGNKNDNSHILPIATLVQIVDFNALPDNLLGITVEGIKLVEVSDIEIAEDDLRLGHVSDIEPWQHKLELAQISPLDTQLLEVFETYPELSNLYQDGQFADPSWVLGRWLELVPIAAKDKQQYLQANQGEQLATFLKMLIE